MGSLEIEPPSANGLCEIAQGPEGKTMTVMRNKLGSLFGELGDDPMSQAVVRSRPCVCFQHALARLATGWNQGDMLGLGRVCG